jgi:hypothetical protein
MINNSIVVDQYLETLRRDAAVRRSTRVERPGLVQRVVARVHSVKAAMSVPLEPALGLPSLNDYPYRS